MRRELSGRVADAAVASDCLGSLVAWPEDAAVGLDPEGETVGNSPDGSVGEVNAPLGNGGNDVPGSELPGSAGGRVEPEPEPELDATTLIVALAWKEVAPLALAVAVSVMLSPADAASRTRAPATISLDWLVGRVPTVQTAPLGWGHTENFGATTFAALPVLTVTVVPGLSAPVLQTKIA
jgi:hypothetical protein